MKIIKLSRALLNKFKSGIFDLTIKRQFLISHHYKTLPRFSQKLTIFSIKSVSFSRFLSSKSGKIHQETENEYAHFIMENSENYSSSVVKCPLTIDNFQFRSKEQLNVFEEFAKLTADCSTGSSLENPKYSSLVKDICTSLPKASGSEIQKVLHYLCLWPSTSATDTPNFKALWNSLDQECVKHLKNWDVSQKLLIADYWFFLRLNRITQYNRELISNLLENCESLSKEQLIQLMFYINLQRHFPEYYLPNLEKKIESLVGSISIEELGIICLAYFKTKNKIQSLDIIQSVIKQLMENLDTVNTVTVAAILKFLRKSLNVSLIDLYILLLHKCIVHIKNLDIPTNVHLALLASECNVYHPLLLTSVSDKLTNGINQARIKDCTKFSLCLTQFNHFEKKFYEALISEVSKNDRKEEILSHPKDIIYFSLYFAYMGYYNHLILSKIFHKNFIELCSKNVSDILPAFAELDYCVEIECKTYPGPKLEPSLRKILDKRKGNLPAQSKHQNMQTRLLSNVYESLLEILGSDENVVIRHILPHVYSPDIIYRFKTGSDKSLAEICQEFPPHVVLRPPKDEIWACFVVCGSFSFARRSKQITGITAMKLRQLQVIGYYVIFIPFYELPLNLSTRMNFIKEQLNLLKERHTSKVY